MTQRLTKRQSRKRPRRLAKRLIWSAMVFGQSARQGTSNNIGKHEVYSVLDSRPTAAVVSVDHLVDLKCIRLAGGGHVLALTELGVELMVAVEA